MRNRQEIIEYLGLEMGETGFPELNEKYIKAAERIEQDFAKELADGTYGYGLHCDFVNNPTLLEDGNDYPTLIEVTNYDGVVIYERRKSE